MKNFTQFINESEIKSIDDLMDKDFAERIKKADKMTSELAKTAKQFLTDNNLMSPAEITKYSKPDRPRFSDRFLNAKYTNYRRFIGNVPEKAITSGFAMMVDLYPDSLYIQTWLHCMAMPEGEDATEEKFIKFANETVKKIASKYGFTVKKGDLRGHYANQNRYNRADRNWGRSLERPFVYFGYTMQEA